MYNYLIFTVSTVTFTSQIIWVILICLELIVCDKKISKLPKMTGANEKGFNFSHIFLVKKENG